MTHQWISDIHSNSAPLFFILGPCAMEDETHALKTAEFLKELSQKCSFNLIFKSSFDKANRSSLGSYRGVGLEAGLRIFEKVKAELELPVVTDIHEAGQADMVAQVVDVLQIPAFLSRQTDLLIAAGKTGKPVFFKKAQFVSADGMGNVVEKIASTGNEMIWLGERGYTFGYNNLVVDYRNFPIMKTFGKPIIMDATHSVQRPGGLGCSTGGNREYVSALSAAAVVQGIAGVFMEVHEEPERALCDGPNSVRLSQLPEFLQYLIDLDEWVKSRPLAELS